MVDQLLWRKLTATDFKALSGTAASSGTGGGAMHIALGVDQSRFPIKSFLGTTESSQIVDAHSAIGTSQLNFDGNPGRRSGEWRITDQYTNRHPAWKSSNGFPETFNSRNPPVVLVAKRDGQYFASYKLLSQIESSIPSLYSQIRLRGSGVVSLSPEWAVLLGFPLESSLPQTITSELSQLGNTPGVVPDFDPRDIQDGRRRILSEVVRRQGQREFRLRLLSAYDARCAVTGCNIDVVLEAAHIAPYRGEATNHVSNGILLRADIHTLFDLGLITIDPRSFSIRVSSRLQGTEYSEYHGRVMSLPNEASKRPSVLALEGHNSTFIP